MSKKLLKSLFFCVFLSACVSTQPHQEYAIAQSALQAAKKSTADKLFPQAYSKALALYKKGARQYRQENYEEARNSFETAIQLAEKAELKARLKQKSED